jgi:2',3'-cyclic-nucleotide 2'-phosphodiesterase
MAKYPEKKSGALRVIFLGDVVGRPGREVVTRRLRELKASSSTDLAIVNGENAAGGAGIDAGTALELKSAGADVVTLGDHAFQRKGVVEFLQKNSDWCIRPYNLPEATTPGKGHCAWTSKDGVVVHVMNFMGRVFMGGSIDCPFRAMDKFLGELSSHGPCITICDMHAEATSEKWAMGRHTDGRLSLLVGTHTHVQTSDAQILPGGTGFITDLGMTGAQSGVIGMDSSVALRRFLSPTPAPYQIAEGEGIAHGIIADIDKVTGKTVWIGLLQDR